MSVPEVLAERFVKARLNQICFRDLVHSFYRFFFAMSRIHPTALRTSQSNPRMPESFEHPARSRTRGGPRENSPSMGGVRTPGETVG